MQSDATIICPNPLCQAPNPESHKFCFQCRTPIPRRYFWAAIQEGRSLRPGEFLSDRYLLLRDQIVLDTQPGLPAELPDEISEAVEAYLKLSIYQPHVPQVFSVVKSSQKHTPDILLLEQAPIYPEDIVSSHSTVSLTGLLMPTLADSWADGNAFQQLTWLWGIASLWQPFSSHGVASSLINPDLVRVEGSLVRLLELQIDDRTPCALDDLGGQWQQWQPTAQPEIADFFVHLCQQLVQGEFRNAEQLVMVLDQALALCGQAQVRQVEIATRTDKGPSRPGNQDACYPADGAFLAIANPGWNTSTSAAPEAPEPVVIVCDGIGGHEDGDVASNLAIATIHQKLQRLTLPSGPIDPTTLTIQLEQSTLAANDVISQRNDAQKRQDRQRMGTTLVMALAHAHELYITHVGDSRAYRMSRFGCHQVTLDDDLASREVRLGYALYRDALRQPGSGSLVQALGMGSSSHLHPTVRRFVLDEDCLFLLCTDGLSDNDRVEQYWQTELLPVLEGKLDVATASQRLVEIANSQNGHDNVTVGLIHCKVHHHDDKAFPIKPLEASLATPPEGSTLLASVSPNAESPLSTSSLRKTQVVRQQHAPGTVPVFLRLAVLVALSGLLIYLAIPALRSWVSSTPSVAPAPTEPIATEPPIEPSVGLTPSSSPTPLRVGSLTQVDRSRSGTEQRSPIPLLSQPPKRGSNPDLTPSIGAIPVGTVLQVSSRQTIPNQGTWLKLRVCSVPPNAETTTETVQPGQVGWAAEAVVTPRVTQELALTPGQLGRCAPDPPLPIPNQKNQRPTNN